MQYSPIKLVVHMHLGISLGRIENKFYQDGKSQWWLWPTANAGICLHPKSGASEWKYHTIVRNDHGSPASAPEMQSSRTVAQPVQNSDTIVLFAESELGIPAHAGLRVNHKHVMWSSMWFLSGIVRCLTDAGRAPCCADQISCRAGLGSGLAFEDFFCISNPHQISKI